MKFKVGDRVRFKERLSKEDEPNNWFRETHEIIDIEYIEELEDYVYSFYFSDGTIVVDSEYVLELYKPPVKHGWLTYEGIGK